MEDDKSLSDYGLTSSTAKAQQPAEVGLAFRSVLNIILFINIAITQISTHFLFWEGPIFRKYFTLFLCYLWYMIYI